MQLVDTELQVPMARGANALERAVSGLTAEQLAWRRFRAEGVNVRAWAIERGFHPGLVYSVLRGERKCVRGQSHQVAVALGLKPSAS
nr:DNA-binding protein [uncultured Roseateles sp.]